MASDKGLNQGSLKIHFAIDPQKAKQARVINVLKHFPNYDSHEADVIVVMGGDGFMLHNLHTALGLEKPVFGLNLGSIGFLMNSFETDVSLQERIRSAHMVEIHPLKMIATCANGSHTTLSFNEVSLLRQVQQAAKIRISIDGQERLEQLTCDGILIATPLGSTAYNSSVSGPIMPITANLMALTPISPFRPRRWRGALLPDHMKVSFQILDPHKRPVSASADFHEIRDVHHIEVSQDRSQSITLLYDSHQSLADRVIAEQFAP